MIYCLNSKCPIRQRCRRFVEMAQGSARYVLYQFGKAKNGEVLCKQYLARLIK